MPSVQLGVNEGHQLFLSTLLDHVEWNSPESGVPCVEPLPRLRIVTPEVFKDFLVVGVGQHGFKLPGLARRRPLQVRLAAGR